MSTPSVNNDNLRDLIMNDKPGIIPDPAIAERLNYYFLLHGRNNPVHSNSFAGIFIWLFSLKNIAAKAIITASLFLFIFIKPQIINTSSNGFADTITSETMVVDTNLVKRDSCK